MININLPIVLLVSILNTNLRDHYSSLEELCDDQDISLDELLEKLNQNNYLYNKEYNQIKEND